MNQLHPISEDRTARAKAAYEEDVRRYRAINGKYERKTWDQLGELEKSTWIGNPTPREW